MQIPTLSEWLDGWENATLDDQSHISHAEAVRRYHRHIELLDQLDWDAKMDALTLEEQSQAEEYCDD